MFFSEFYLDLFAIVPGSACCTTVNIAVWKEKSSASRNISRYCLGCSMFKPKYRSASVKRLKLADNCTRLQDGASIRISVFHWVNYSMSFATIMCSERKNKIDLSQDYVLNLHG